MKVTKGCIAIFTNDYDSPLNKQTSEVEHELGFPPDSGFL